MTQKTKLSLGLTFVLLILAGSVIAWGIQSGSIVPRAEIFSSPSNQFGQMQNIFARSFTSPLNEIKQNEKISFRFTAPENLSRPLTVRLNSWKKLLQTGLYSYNLKVRLCKNGLNNNPDLNQCSPPAVLTGQELTCRWKTLNLTPAWNLSKGNIYHLVTEFYSSSGRQYIRGGICAGGTPGLWPRGRGTITRNSPDPMLSTLKYVTSWTNLNQAPNFLLQDSANLRAGQPYTQAFSTSLGGEVYAGERITVDVSGMNFSQIGLRLQKNGTPSDDLHLELREINASYRLVAFARIDKNNILSTIPGEQEYIQAVWEDTSSGLYTGPTSGGITLYNGGQYDLLLSSPGSSAGAYTVYGTSISTYANLGEPLLTYLKGETYGGINSTVVTGNLTGGVFSRAIINDLADLNFKFE